jgi:hypothetical protein
MSSLLPASVVVVGGAGNGDILAGEFERKKRKVFCVVILFSWFLFFCLGYRVCESIYSVVVTVMTVQSVTNLLKRCLLVYFLFLPN